MKQQVVEVEERKWRTMEEGERKKKKKKRGGMNMMRVC